MAVGARPARAAARATGRDNPNCRREREAAIHRAARLFGRFGHIALFERPRCHCACRRAAAVSRRVLPCQDRQGKKIERRAGAWCSLSSDTCHWRVPETIIVLVFHPTCFCACRAASHASLRVGQIPEPRSSGPDLLLWRIGKAGSEARSVGVGVAANPRGSPPCRTSPGHFHNPLGFIRTSATVLRCRYDNVTGGEALQEHARCKTPAHCSSRALMTFRDAAGSTTPSCLRRSPIWICLAKCGLVLTRLSCAEIK